MKCQNLENSNRYLAEELAHALVHGFDSNDRAIASIDQKFQDIISMSSKEKRTPQNQHIDKFEEDHLSSSLDHRIHKQRNTAIAQGKAFLKELKEKND